MWTPFQVQPAHWPGYLSSEIGLQGYRQAEEFSGHGIARRFGACSFVHRLGTTIVSHNRGPFGVERFRIVIGQRGLERLTIRKHLVVLHQVESGAVWRSKAVNDGFVVEADGVDNQRIAFIVTNGLAIP